MPATNLVRSDQLKYNLQSTSLKDSASGNIQCHNSWVPHVEENKGDRMQMQTTWQNSVR